MKQLSAKKRETIIMYYNNDKASDVIQYIIEYVRNILATDGIDTADVVKAMPVAIISIDDPTEELKEIALNVDPCVIGMISNLTLADLKFAMNIDPSAIYSVDDKTLNMILNTDTVMYIKSIPELDSDSILRACGRYEF